ncbi:hypothetical protein, partial [Nostoc sp.]|uniref:hypothetical protein n=1 Tax=Nostoc sp. TaxID=1180 RepID=UPI002FF5E711
LWSMLSLVTNFTYLISIVHLIVSHSSENRYITILNNLICSLKHFISIFQSQVVEGEAFNSKLPTIYQPS